MLKNTLARIALAASLLAAPACADRGAPQLVAVNASELDKPGNMTVTGTAVLEVSPDCADLTMTIVGEGARPGQATAAVQRQQQELVESLKKIGVEGADLKLSYLIEVFVLVVSMGLVATFLATKKLKAADPVDLF